MEPTRTNKTTHDCIVKGDIGIHKDLDVNNILSGGMTTCQGTAGGCRSCPGTQHHEDQV